MSNTNQGHTNSLSRETATAFTTGSSTSYTISSVDIQLRRTSSGETVVRIRRDNEGTPGDVVATLTNPDSFNANALNTFTVPEGTNLTGNTTYFLVTNDGRSSDINVQFSGTNNDAQTGVTGWSIADSSILRRVKNAAWTKGNTSLRFSITGAAANLIDLTVSESGAVTEGDAPLTLTATRNETNTSGSPLSIPIQIKTSGTTAQPADYTLGAMSISIPNNSATGTTTFAVTDDSDIEATETVVIELGTLPSGNAVGSNKEVTITITDDDAPPPAKPTNLTAIEGYRQITLNWDDPSNSNIDDYQFRQKAGEGSYGSWTSITNSDATTATYTVTGLTNGTTYTFQVRAGAGAATGTASEEVSATPRAYLQTTLVSNANQSNDGASTAEIATAFTTGSNSLNYTISSVDIQTLDAAPPGFGVKSTVARIRSNNSGAPGDVVAMLNNPSSFRSNALNTFTAPEGTTLAGNTTYFLVINDGRRIALGNNFQFSTTNSDEQTSPAGWSIANSGISRAGRNAAWRTSASLRFSITGADVNLVDLAISGGGVINEGDAPLTLTATRNETNTSGSALSIPIQIKTSGTTAQPADYTLGAMSISIPNNSDTGTTTFSVTDDSGMEATETVVIELGTLPSGSVVGSNNVAGSSKEVTITITDNDAPPPAKPTNLTATEGYRQITLNWDDPGNSAIDDYQFRQKAGSGSYGSWTDIAGSDATTTTHTVTGLTNGTTYTFQVRAGNGMINGTASEEVSATPRAYLQTTLVSNTNQGHNFSSDLETATAFTTGSSTSYTISSVDIQVLNTSSGRTVVRIRTDNSGTPGDVVATLTNPSSIKANALNTFTAPEGTNLTGNTTYFLVANDGSRASGNVQFSATNSDEQTSPAGWSIANSLIFRRNNTVWTTNNASLRFSITGAAVNRIDLTVSESGTITEGDAPLTLTATRSETNTSGSALSVPILVKTSGTTAQPGDYTLGSMSISIPNNSDMGTTTFSVTDDSDMEAAETVVIELGTLPPGNVAGSNKEVMITITDDDFPEITIAAGTSPVTEGTAASFTISASPMPASNLTVNLSIAEAAGSDFVASGNEGMKTVMIPASGSMIYTVATEDDNTDEPDGSVTVTVVNGTGYTVGDPSAATVMVNDDDEAPLGIEDTEEALIFPNPSGDYLEVRSPVVGKFKILSLSGKLLLECTTNTRVDITSLKSGLYLVQLPDGRLLKFVRE